MEGLDKELPRFLGHNGKLSISSISSISSMGSVKSIPDSQILWSPRDGAFVVKAVYNECVIVFRAERKMSLMAIRQRIRERFALHECVPLDDDFLLGYLPTRPTTTAGGRRGRSNSVNSMASDISHLRLLKSDADWQAAMATSNDKIALRLFDADPHL